MLWDIVGYLVVGPCPPFHTLQLWELWCFIFSHTCSLEHRSDGNEEDNTHVYSLLFGYVMGLGMDSDLSLDMDLGMGLGLGLGMDLGLGLVSSMDLYAVTPL